ncbi:transposase [Streptomyces sp. VRA16 Mangrove soil]|uniref:IS701 family transposase n=1 Tax=Streptomyces sp. VRA16 Mangrove soil TaxID=2817434 RepID=UPI001A9DEE4C|nr:transposase [Streptomyces sp. VRA16 Mangrove soil]MBO1337159.1 transposase [Streptomyces sp. VRA16 Mangrove soil]
MTTEVRHRYDARLLRRPGAGLSPAQQARIEMRRQQEQFLREILGSLSRRDQRERAERYMRGLLTADGRKSIRNIAACLGLPDEEQRLHHFISGSTWSWDTMRAGLASWVGCVASPQAWVVQAVTIPKVGDHTVGVDRFFDPQAGQMVAGQRAFGAWLATPDLSVPVNWKLYLPRHWLSDGALRTRADIPSALDYASLEECAADVVADPTRMWGTAPRPVLMDLRGHADWRALHRLSAAGMPVLARISPTTRLVVDDPAFPASRATVQRSCELLGTVASVRRGVEWLDPARSAEPCLSQVAAVRVRIPGAAPGLDRPLLLLGEWRAGQASTAQVWITHLTKVPPATLLQLTKLTRRVAWDAQRGVEQTGARDFVGRSYGGWHRHLTLASTAHTVRMIADRGSRPDPAGPAGAAGSTAPEAARGRGLSSSHTRASAGTAVT